MTKLDDLREELKCGIPMLVSCKSDLTIDELDYILKETIDWMNRFEEAIREEQSE